MVKAIRVHQPGGPEVLRMEEIELAPPAKGEIQIQGDKIAVSVVDLLKGY